MDDWVADGLVKPHTPHRVEIQRLFELVDRDVADAAIPDLSVDRRFAAAYSAALGLATIVLRASGYRAASSAPGHHLRTIALLPELMSSGQVSRKTYLDSCRRARNEATYDRINVVGETEVDELLDDVSIFRQEVTDWLRREHPDLI